MRGQMRGASWRPVPLLACNMAFNMAFFDKALPVAERYAPIRTDAALFQPELVRDWLHPDFETIVRRLGQGEDIRDLVTEEAHEVYSFPFLRCGRAHVPAASYWGRLVL